MFGVSLRFFSLAKKISIETPTAPAASFYEMPNLHWRGSAHSELERMKNI
jgi:hypothetical protein